MSPVSSPSGHSVPWYRHPAFVVPLALVVLGALLVFVSYRARVFLSGSPSTVCIVTAESLAYDASSPQEAGTSYSSDHPTDPEVGDKYDGLSGCLAYETVCLRTVEPFGSRLDC